MCWFILGCFVGTVVGFFVAAMMAVSKDSDERMCKK